MQDQEINTPHSKLSDRMDVKFSKLDLTIQSIDQPLKFGGWLAKLFFTGLAAGVGTVTTMSVADKLKARRARRKADKERPLRVAGQ